MKYNHPAPNKGAATPGKDQLTGAAAEFRYLDRKNSNTTDKRNSEAQSTVISITYNGTKRFCTAPCFPALSLRENLAITYLSLEKTGESVVDLTRCRLRSTGQTSWTFQISEDPAAHQSFKALYRAAAAA